MRTILLMLTILLTFSPLCGDQKPSIVIVTYKVQGASPWDPDSIRSGITGSEEAVIYAAQELVQLGYDVLVMGDPPQNSVYSKLESNPRYVDVNYSDNLKRDIAIAWRTPWRAEELKKYANSVYLWPHDTYNGRLSPAQIQAFDGVLWLSKWQRDYWIAFNPEFAAYTSIFGNGIDPQQFPEIKDRKNPYACAYGSNYARGLELLLDIWPQVKQQFSEATLDIYYGWQHWGLLTPEREAKMRHQLVIYKDLNLGVTEHGLVSHEKLNQAYAQASFWTYPCTDTEVFCITGIRAQLSGAIPVIIESAALQETVPFGYHCMRADEYLTTLTKALNEAKQITLDQRKQMGEFVLREYTWKAIAEKWKALFNAKRNEPSSMKSLNNEA